MTLAQLRTAIRNIVKEWDTDSGTLFPSNNTMLDFYINWATEDVALELADYIPTDFLDYEDITLVADQNNYDLTAEWLQIWAMQKNVSDESPKIIPYIPVHSRAYKEYVGQTSSEPAGWYLDGTTIMFTPTPSTAKTDYARCWIIVPEGESVGANGPTYIPRIAHKLIVLEAAILVGTMNGVELRDLMILYKMQFERVTNVLAYRIQQQPNFLQDSMFSRQQITTKDPALFDLGSEGMFR